MGTNRDPRHGIAVQASPVDTTLVLAVNALEIHPEKAVLLIKLAAQQHRGQWLQLLEHLHEQALGPGQVKQALFH